MNELGAGIYGILLWLNKVMCEMQENLAVRIRNSPRAACKEIINLSVTDFTAASIVTSKAPAQRSPPTSEVASARGDTPMDLDVVLFRSVPLLAEAGKTGPNKNATCHLIADMRPSDFSAPHTVISSSSVDSDGDRPLVVDQAQATPAIPVVASTTTLATSEKVLFEQRLLVVGTLSYSLASRPRWRRLSGRQGLPHLLKVVPVVSSVQARVRESVWGAGRSCFRTLKCLVVGEIHLSIPGRSRQIFQSLPMQLRQPVRLPKPRPPMKFSILGLVTMVYAELLFVPLQERVLFPARSQFYLGK